jgi:ABC-type uncharacterized transport system involved in gliding motility auxiliary subunit
MANLSKNWDRRKLGIASLILLPVFFLALHVLSTESLRRVTIDLTEERLYTLSDGTKNVLKNMREPIVLRLFMSDELLDTSPGLKDYGRQVRELLDRYVELSGGLLKLEIIRPQPFSTEEDRAVGFGLQGIPITQAGNLGYFGLAGTNTTDDLDTIPFLTRQREPFLEYDLSRMVQNLANPKKKKVGFVSSLPIEADPLKRYRPWEILKHLREAFDVEKITLENPVPEDVDLLMVVHPREMDEVDRYYIDQHIMRGGKTIIVVDPFSEIATQGNRMNRQPPDTGSDLPKLLKSYGIVYDKSKVLGDRLGAQRVNAGRDSLGRPVITDFIAWVTLRDDRLNKNDVVSGQLEQIAVASSGTLDIAPGSKLKMTPLLTSSKEAMQIEVESVKKDPKPAKLLKNFKSADKKFVISGRFTGMLDSAFKSGKPKDKIRDQIKAAQIKKGEKVVDDLPHLNSSQKEANILVIADTDMLADGSWVRTQNFFGRQMTVPVADNADFLFNAVDTFTGSADLIGLRSRGVSGRPFRKVEEMKRSAELRYRAKEQGLLEKLAEIEKKLKELQTKETAAGTTVILSEDQKAAIEKFRRESVTIRKDLRAVQLALREDIDRLEAWLKAINIGLVPVIVMVFAICFGLFRRGRSKRARASAVAA